MQREKVTSFEVSVHCFQHIIDGYLCCQLGYCFPVEPGSSDDRCELGTSDVPTKYPPRGVKSDALTTEDRHVMGCEEIAMISHNIHRRSHELTTTERQLCTHDRRR